MSKLNEYNKKRDFDNTKEPKGKVKQNKTNKTKFVIQYHQARAKHYDLRLEHNGVLLSWAVPKGLSQNPKDKRLAVMVEDHPLDYINFEGVIPKGNYGAGTVQIFDKGFYIPLIDFDVGLKKGHLKFELKGKVLNGSWDLIKTDAKNWLVIKTEDEFAIYTSKAKKTDKLPFKKSSVMLATLTEQIPQGKNWLFEIKYDGYRILSFIENKKVKLITRNNNDYTNKFSTIEKSLSKLSNNMVLDGEVVTFNENGKSDFGLLQESIKHNKNNLSFVVFDILALNNKDLRTTPLIERKKILEQSLVNLPENIVISSYVINKGKQSFNLAKKLNLEGIVAKKTDSLYIQKRSEDWLKIKCYLRQEFVIVGFTTTDKNKLLSALLLGYYQKDKLIYVGKVGTGFNEDLKKELSVKLNKITSTKTYLTKAINIKNQNITWVKPQLVAEIQFAEITKDKVLRQPSFIGLRQDKSAKQVVLEVAHAK